MTRRLAAVISLVLCGAALEPLVRAPDDDGFPLSTYPMFAVPRSGELTMASVRCARGDGGPCPLSPDHLGTGEVMQAFATVQRAAAAGPAARAALCAAIAARVAGDGALRDAVEIRMVSGTYDAVGEVAGAGSAGGSPVGREAILTRCDVVRSPR